MAAVKRTCTENYVIMNQSAEAGLIAGNSIPLRLSTDSYKPLLLASSEARNWCTDHCATRHGADKW